MIESQRKEGDAWEEQVRLGVCSRGCEETRGTREAREVVKVQSRGRIVLNIETVLQEQEGMKKRERKMRNRRTARYNREWMTVEVIRMRRRPRIRWKDCVKEDVMGKGNK